MEWLNTDPREYIDGHDNIVILRPSLISIKWTIAGTAITDFEDYECINADMKWDPSWK